MRKIHQISNLLTPYVKSYLNFIDIYDIEYIDFNKYLKVCILTNFFGNENKYLDFYSYVWHDESFRNALKQPSPYL